MVKGEWELNRLYRDHFYGSADSSFGNRITHRFQFFIRAFFHGILTLEMDKIGTLLSLFLAMAANLYQRFNHPIESIDLVVPYDQATGLIIRGERIGLLPRFGARITLYCGHRIQKYIKHTV